MPRGAGERVGALGGQPRGGSGAVVAEHDGGLDLRRDLEQVRERVRDPRRHGPQRYSWIVRGVVAKFYADRGTHLAAMIAYFALLAFVPLTFLALSLLGFAGRADESSFLVNELRQALPPETPIEDIVRLVRTVQENAATLGILGAAFLIWTALSFFSVLESAFNIVYGRPNRAFLHGKGVAIALMIGSLTVLFVALIAGSLSVDGIRRILPGVAGDDLVVRTFSIAISTLGAFVFTTSSYYLLTNVALRRRGSFRAASRRCSCS